MKKILLIGFFCCFMQQAWSQSSANRYMVFFTNKTPCEAELANPQNYLSERALTRRDKQHIALSLEDVPPCTEYLATLQQYVQTILFTSRWMNAALVVADEKQAGSLPDLTFVREVILGAPGDKPESRLKEKEKTYHFLSMQQRLQAPVQFELLGIPALQKAGYTGKGKLLAMLDAGFAGVDQDAVFDHLFRNDQLIATKNFVANSDQVYLRSTHGSKALSTIVAVDSGNYIGTAPEATLALALTEAIENEYRIEEFNWLIAAEWADSLGADVISSSLGYSTFDDPAMNYTYEDLDGKTTISAQAVEAAARKGMLVVVSNGNSGNTAWRYMNTPADAPSALAVGATNSTGEKASFSSFGPTADGRIKPDVSAMGAGTLVANGAGGFSPSNGTSFSAPQISGLALALWQAYPNLSAAELAQHIREAGNQAEAPDNELGYGIPSYIRFSQLVSATPYHYRQAFSVYPNPVNGPVFFLQLKEGRSIEQLRLYDASGSMIRLNLLSQPEKVAGQPDLYKISFDQAKAGMYILEVQFPGKLQRMRLLKF